MLKPFSIIIVYTCTIIMLSAQSPKDWLTLFNGRNLKNWNVKIHHHDYNVNFGKTFRVNKQKNIEVSYDQYGKFNEQFGHLYYEKPFSHFHLSMEYRFKGEVQEGSPSYVVLNSGVMYHSQDPKTMPKEQDWPISIEMQFLADLNDGKPRPTGNMCSPGTDIEYQGKKYPGHCLNSNSPTIHKNEWVKAELRVLGDSLIQHIINGKVVLEYTHPTMGGGVANRYDPKIWIEGKPLKEGFIALQSEGQPIEFRDIRLLNLKGCMDKKAKNYKAYFVENDVMSCKY